MTFLLSFIKFGQLALKLRPSRQFFSVYIPFLCLPFVSVHFTLCYVFLLSFELKGSMPAQPSHLQDKVMGVTCFGASVTTWRHSDTWSRRAVSEQSHGYKGTWPVFVECQWKRHMCLKHMISAGNESPYYTVQSNALKMAATSNECI